MGRRGRGYGGFHGKERENEMPQVLVSLRLVIPVAADSHCTQIIYRLCPAG